MSHSLPRSLSSNTKLLLQISKTGSNPIPYSHFSKEQKKTADKKIEEFKRFLDTRFDEGEYVPDYLVRSISFSQSVDEGASADEGEGEGGPKMLFLSYFIGRCNPPHSGHIAALLTLLNDVKIQHETGSDAKALILLGSGPGKKQTQDNPIGFALKRKFIRYKLKQRLGGISDAQLDKLCEIKEMNNSFGDVPYFVKQNIQGRDITTISSIQITHYAGDKDGDTTKLAGVGERSERVAIDLTSNSLPVIKTTEAIRPISSGTGEKSMSATKVRTDVYVNLTREQWLSEYRDFYEPFSEILYSTILRNKDVKYKRGGRTFKKLKPYKKDKKTRCFRFSIW
jgi:hypothetical protein